jgi:hypothetical protein
MTPPRPSERETDRSVLTVRVCCAMLYRDRVLCCIACCLDPATDRIFLFTVSVYQCTVYMVIGDNYQVAVWFVEVLVSRSRHRAGLSGFYCLDDLHLESQARLGVVNSYLRYELVSYTND